MNSFKIKIADVVFKVNPYTNDLEPFCKDYLTNQDYEYEITIQNEDLIFEGNAFKAYYGYYNNVKKLNEQFSLLRKVSKILAADKNTFIFHASSLILDNKTYSFTGISGTGKTTHAKMWLKKYPNAVMINDDKPFIRYKDDTFTIFGSPWMGKEQIGSNISGKLSGIFCLEKSDTNQIIEMTYQEKFDFLIMQFFFSYEPKILEKTIQILDYLINKIPIYGLKCTKDISAVDLAIKALKGD